MQLPLITAPMFLVSSVELVVAACRHGALGSFPTGNARTLEMLEQWLRDISAALTPQDAPWAVNLVVHRSYERLEQDLALVERYRPPLVITALGSPRHVIDRVHGYGGLVFADVNTLKHARQATALGVDGLVLVAAGAGGHTGQMGAFAMVPGVREFFEGTLVLGGGLTDGAGIRAAEVLGADLASMGTRFIACEETLASEGYRQMLVDSSIEDLILTAAVSGVPAYWLRKSLTAAGFDIDAIERGVRMESMSPSNYGRWTKIWSAGHGVGSIKAIESAATVLQRLATEYWKAVDQAPVLHRSLTRTQWAAV
ncbi:nitronate monooxygenase [Paraburkholderia acidicola]|uniref:Nitronate monooxygenase n=1 Tax=Paraburkholderia acidicola TaxID=1912599 RepID=A0ABV1LXT3_9BURK